MTYVYTPDELFKALNSIEVIDELICNDLEVTDAVLNFADVSNVEFHNCTFTNCIIQDAYLGYGTNENLTFNYCVIYDNSIYAHIEHCTLHDCIVDVTSLTNATVDQLTITDSNLRHVLAEFTSIHELILTNTSMHGVVDNSRVEHATIRSSVIDTMQFQNNAVPLSINAIQATQAAPSPYDANTVYR